MPFLLIYGVITFTRVAIGSKNGEFANRANIKDTDQAALRRRVVGSRGRAARAGFQDARKILNIQIASRGQDIRDLSRFAIRTIGQDSSPFRAIVGIPIARRAS